MLRKQLGVATAEELNTLRHRWILLHGFREEQQATLIFVNHVTPTTDEGRRFGASIEAAIIFPELPGTPV